MGSNGWPCTCKVDRVSDLNFNGGEGDRKVTYGDVFLQAEKEYSRLNFEAPTPRSWSYSSGGGDGVPQVS